MADEATYSERVMKSYTGAEADIELKKGKGYVNLKDGEKVTVRIHPEPIEQVEVDFGNGPVVRWRIHVTDLADDQEKTWTMGPRLLAQIRAFTQDEVDVITFIRHGTGLDTIYTLKPEYNR